MKKIAILNLLIFSFLFLEAKVGLIRAVYLSNPSYSIDIQWVSFSGENPAVYYSTEKSEKCFENVKAPYFDTIYKGLHHYFVRLENLKPDTKYYFYIKDTEGKSKIYWFKTLPENPQSLSIIAGGDSRTRKRVRRLANIMVRKLQPDFVIFDGDYTQGATAKEWKKWLSDWQLTISEDGHIIPLVIASGNHERDLDLYAIFHIPKNGYYNLQIGKNYLEIWALNSETKIDGKQASWLKNTLKQSKAHWKIAAFHKPIRPHNSHKYKRYRKTAQLQYKFWAYPFYEYGVHLVLEGDTHICKMTYQIKPDSTHNSPQEDGFVIDSIRGTLYVGEGTWGAPLRTPDKTYAWTIDAAKINQFKWIWIYPDKMIVRTVIYDNAKFVKQLSANDKFNIPKNINLWKPKGLEYYILKHF